MYACVRKYGTLVQVLMCAGSAAVSRSRLVLQWHDKIERWMDSYLNAGQGKKAKEKRLAEGIGKKWSNSLHYITSYLVSCNLRPAYPDWPDSIDLGE